MVTREEYLEAKAMLSQIEAVIEQLPNGQKLGSSWIHCKLDCEIVVLKWQIQLKEKVLKALKG